MNGLAKYNRYARPMTSTLWSDSLFDSFLSDMTPFWSTPTAKDTTTRFMPAVDVKEEEDRIELTADLPGIKREDIKLEIDDGHLVLSGERIHEKETTEKGKFYSERSFGHFERRFRLGESINTEAIEARFEDGVLKVVIPRLNPEQQKSRIEIM